MVKQNPNQPDLFDQIGKTVEQATQIAQERVDAIAASGDLRNAGYDPNDRRAADQRNRGVGGGIATHLEGDLVSSALRQDPEGKGAEPTGVVRDHFFELPGISMGRTNPANQPVSNREMRRAKDGMTAEEIDKQSLRNATNAAAIKRMLAEQRAARGKK